MRKMHKKDVRSKYQNGYENDLDENNAEENDEKCENYVEENYDDEGAKEQVSENNTQSMNCPKFAKQFINMVI